jgi:HD-GYP domain-containing protein (c-di-GMP phosphodiesterase class II)
MAHLLLLGPDRPRAAGLRALLARDGHAVTWLRSLAGWLDREREIRPDVVVAAVVHTDSVLATADRPAVGFPPPLLFVRQEADFQREPHLQGRLIDSLVSPFMSDELLARVDALVRVHRIVDRQGSSHAGSRRGGWPGLKQRVSSWVKTRLPEKEKPAGPYLEVAARVAEWADRRDAFEPGHAARVTSFCALIAEGLGMGEEETTELLHAATLHDIGKVGLPLGMLHQQQPLAEEQRRLIRTHPARGAALLRALDPDEQVARVVLYHHERPDGTGYYGKKPEAVPRAAYALAVAETYDAMTSSLLGETVDSEEALDILMSGRGSAYEGNCVEALADALRPQTTSIRVSDI